MNYDEIEIPISNIEAEAALIAALMIEPKLIETASERLSPDDFADDTFAHVFDVILRQNAQGKSTSPVGLRPFVDPETFGILVRLTGGGAVGTVGAKHYVEQIRDLAKRRRLVGGLKSTISLASDLSQPAESLIEAADAAIASASGEGDGIHQPTGADCLTEVMRSFDNPRVGVRCGSIPAADDILGMVKAKQLLIMAARPGMGKTAVALSYGLGAAKRGHGTMFVSLEMSSEELGARMASDLCFDIRPIPFEKIQAGTVTVDQMRTISEARDALADIPFRVVDAGGMTVGRLNMLVRRHSRRMAANGEKLELLIVDYLQLMRPDGRTNGRYEAITEVSMGLKALAKDHGITVLALAQLSRDVEKRDDKRPQLSDLRDSGQIEQDADGVVFLFREEYYHRLKRPDPQSASYQQWEADLSAIRGDIEFIVAKRRNGRVGKAVGTFHADFQAVR